MIVVSILICLVIIYVAICAGVYLYQEICAEVNKFKRWKKQAIWDIEWQWKLMRKDSEKCHLKSLVSEVIMRLMMRMEILYALVTRKAKHDKMQKKS